jgi:hypothetical protein
MRGWNGVPRRSVRKWDWAAMRAETAAPAAFATGFFLVA